MFITEREFDITDMEVTHSIEWRQVSEVPTHRLLTSNLINIRHNF